MSKERRYLNADQGAEIRSAKDSRTVEGYAIVFNKESKDFGGWKEVIDPSAMNGILEDADVLALLDHDTRRGVLARYTSGTGSLTLSVDATGVKYNFDAPGFAAGEELLEGIERGDIRTSSFAFSVAEGGAKWEKQEDDSYIRRITAFQDIYDVSAVYREAYPDTTVAKRSLEELRKEDPKKSEEQELEEQKKKDNQIASETPSFEELTDHYSELEKQIDEC